MRDDPPESITPADRDDSSPPSRQRSEPIEQSPISGRIGKWTTPAMIGPQPSTSLAALSEAGSTEELWRRLVFGGGLPPSTNSWDAELLWRHQHGEDQSGALDTALLLCTDHGSRHPTARSVKRQSLARP